MGYTEHVRLLAHQRLHPCVLTQEAGARREGGAAGGWDSGAHAYTHKHTHTHLLIAKRARDFKGLGKVVDRVLTVGDKFSVDTEIKQVHKIVRSILYYARAVDLTVLMALSTIASERMKGTKKTLEKAYQVLDYLASHPNATV